MSVGHVRTKGRAPCYFHPVCAIKVYMNEDFSVRETKTVSVGQAGVYLSTTDSHIDSLCRILIVFYFLLPFCFILVFTSAEIQKRDELFNFAKEKLRKDS